MWWDVYCIAQLNRATIQELRTWKVTFWGGPILDDSKFLTQNNAILSRILGKKVENLVTLVGWDVYCIAHNTPPKHNQ